ncbi:MAG: hypothetical protein FVQ81_05225 [Candidatus Glassbacteria bacterium]|nr:hypothetical protein [Candidatus Glassbacteria bacterium]
MSENRSQDIQLVKLAIQVEKDGQGFLEQFSGKIENEESDIKTFIVQIQEAVAEDLETLESVMSGLEDEQSAAEMEEKSLDDYIKEMQAVRNEKFYPADRLKDLFEDFFNPIRVLDFMSEALKEQAEFYTNCADNIFYENEKKVFLELAGRKNEQANEARGKKKEIISRFP